MTTLTQFADLEILDLLAEALADDRSAIFRSLPREPRAVRSGGRLIPTKVEKYMLARYREQVGLVLRTTIKDRIVNDPILGMRFFYRPRPDAGMPAAHIATRGGSERDQVSPRSDRRPGPFAYLDSTSLGRLAEVSVAVDACGAAWIQAGIVLQIAGHFNEATKLLMRIASGTPQTRLRLSAMNNAAESQLDAGCYPRAIRIYKQAVAHDPESPFIALRSLLAAYRGADGPAFSRASDAVEDMLDASSPWVQSMRRRTQARYRLNPRQTGYIGRPLHPPTEAYGEVTATVLAL